MPYKDTTKQKEYLHEYSKSYHQKRYDKRKREMIDYLGGECAECGATTSLEFDHIVREGKKFSITRLWNRRWGIIKPELDKCQLLCHDCHLEKTRLERIGD